MYAIIATGGKQYKVAEGDIIYIEKLKADQGDTVTFDEVIAVNNDKDLLCGDKVAKAKVTGEVLGEGKSKRKTGYHKKQGHRQPYTKVEIKEIHA